VSTEPLVDRLLLEKLERLTLHWQRSFPGLIGGHNTSRFAGSGLEFLDHRNFHAGDDLRAVNWRAYMRLEKLFLKMFQIEPRVPVRMMVDISRSMTTGESISKFVFARRLAAAMCYVGLVKLDTITIQPFSNKLHDSFICGGGRHRFMPAADYLQALEPAEGSSDFLACSKAFIGKYVQRGLLIVISDFLDDQDCLKPLQYLADYGHELLLIQTYAPEDRVPPWKGELDLEDAETGQHLEISFDDEALKHYTAAFDEHTEAIKRLALRNTGRFSALSTQITVEEAIFGPLAATQGIA
jgi:uncharacterized protein (DUF58 family)